jgi:hypothetical protein
MSRRYLASMSRAGGAHAAAGRRPADAVALESSPPLRHETEVDVAAMLEGLKATAAVLSATGATA